MKGCVARVKGSVQRVKGCVHVMRGCVQPLKGCVERVKGCVERLNGRVRGGRSACVFDESRAAGDGRTTKESPQADGAG